MNAHFKRPLKITLITFVVLLFVVIAGSTWVYFSKASDRKKKEQVTLLGGALGFIASVGLAPFCIAAAAKIGKEKREARGK
jgi:flagellar basal body-associated protein FliL